VCKIIHIVNRITDTSIPIELATSLNKTLDIIIISLYDQADSLAKTKKNMNFDLEIVPLEMTNKIDIIKYINLYKVIKKIKPDIIHTHHSFSGFLARIIAKIAGNIKIVTTIHTDIRFISWYQKLLRLSTLNFADQIVFNSNNTQKSFSTWNKFLRKNIRKKVIYNGVDFKKISQAKDKNFIKNYSKKNGFWFGTVGRLEKVKDQETLIKAFNIFNNQFPETKLFIVGAGSEELNLKKLVKKLSINNNVIFTGLLKREEVYKLINELDLFIISSKYDGFCNAMVEAMVAGNAIIASNIDPLPEVLGENNGLFFEQGNIENLAEKMIYLYQNEQKRKELAEKAKGYAIKNYSLEKCVNEYKKVYLELLS
jgi:glycosyltransferase involved in cell wall biosynthesis